MPVSNFSIVVLKLRKPIVFFASKLFKIKIYIWKFLCNLVALKYLVMLLVHSYSALNFRFSRFQTSKFQIWTVRSSMLTLFKMLKFRKMWKIKISILCLISLNWIFNGQLSLPLSLKFQYFNKMAAFNLRTGAFVECREVLICWREKCLSVLIAKQLLKNSGTPRWHHDWSCNGFKRWKILQEPKHCHQFGYQDTAA